MFELFCRCTLSQTHHVQVRNKKILVFGLMFALVTATAVLFWPVTTFEATNFDDGDYVFENADVLRGLTISGTKWAFESAHAANWHPITWLSHMTDVEMIGTAAGAQHGMNLLFHCANSALVFILLLRLTGATWRSGLVAFLFAIHPLHVESVAWIAERKDMLSTFFGLLALLAYASYAGPQYSKSKVFYTLTLLFFTLGLLSKPMLVTWPFVLLLLDFWPLRRLTWPLEAKNVCALVTEKWPFFLVTAAFCFMLFFQNLIFSAQRIRCIRRQRERLHS